MRVFFEKGASCVCLSSKGGLICVSFFGTETHVSCLFLKGRLLCVFFFKRETHVWIIVFDANIMEWLQVVGSL